MQVLRLQESMGGQNDARQFQGGRLGVHIEADVVGSMNYFIGLSAPPSLKL